MSDFSYDDRFRNPQTAKHFYMRGLAKDFNGDYLGAIEDFTEAIEREPDNLNLLCRALTSRSSAWYLIENYENAIIDSSRVVELQPEFSQGYYIRGLSRLKLGDKTKACLDLSKAGELGDTQAEKALNEFCR